MVANSSDLSRARNAAKIASAAGVRARTTSARSLLDAATQKPAAPGQRPRPLWQRLYKRFGALIGLSLAGAAVYVGWAGRDTRSLSADAGLGYALGILAVACILILLVYPLRKRIRLLRFLGSTKDWFRTHMIFGILGPLLALYHCNFQLGSLNSRIALFSALIIAGSGVIGRFLYTKIHKGLYGRKTNLQELLAKVKLTPPEGGQAATYLPELMRRISAFDHDVLKPPTGTLDSFVLPVRLLIQTRRKYHELVWLTRRRLIAERIRSPLVAEHQKQLEKATRRFIATHLRHVRRVAEFAAYERLFALWHKIHLPFFFLLVVSTLIHVIVVHFYR